MDAGAKFNRANPAVKRILQECKEIANERSRDFHAEVLEDNIFEWHFAIRGPSETDFEVRALAVALMSHTGVTRVLCAPRAAAAVGVAAEAPSWSIWPICPLSAPSQTRVPDTMSPRPGLNEPVSGGNLPRAHPPAP